MKTIDDLEQQLGGLRGKRVLVRSDLNVPLDHSGDAPRITDDGRVRASVPTLRRLLDAGARVVVTAHLGRPKGAPEAKYSLAPVHARLAELLEGVDVSFCPVTVGDEATAAVEALADGSLVLLENVRFNAAETSKDDAERGGFADALAALADGYVSDGFGAVHRKHASVYDVAQRLPHAAGGLVAAEVEVLRRLTASPERPYAVVLGGSKVSDKLGVIDNLLGSLLTSGDRVLVGGGMVFTFLKAAGHEVGKSLLEEDQLETVRGYVRTAAEKGVELVLPTDVVAAAAFAADAEHDVVPVEAIPADRLGLDIGPNSAETFTAKLADARTVFWNGPMGVFEMEPYAGGTRAVAQALADSEAFSVVGGGDSAAAVRTLGFADSQFGHISTGGGASLEYLEGKQLPGLDVLG
ncbi:phosphoglycerate kinase [Paenibacillus sp. TRM 82003]|uniref:phosphoglycerate kinase n=1 Tax=Kineococcus sp. TRM81007 TaxID=2925831 RepID=UPI001F5AE7C5|nr:phosphoglycerate kinase [Kineococcus sp. TRM81007]MCI2237628.1 phosphoglycerate kinase [Kineococcus sp. TRM81007]MCI3921645.1 phosphoglycerate kinase [Paenibacillus sp. TRM 82003]